MQICHISDWYAKDYRPFNTAIPLCNACTDYVLLDKTLLHSVSNSFSPKNEEKMPHNWIEDGVKYPYVLCNARISAQKRFWASSTQQMFWVKASIFLIDPDVLKCFKANGNWNDIVLIYCHLLKWRWRSRWWRCVKNVSIIRLTLYPSIIHKSILLWNSDRTGVNRISKTITTAISAIKSR